MSSPANVFDLHSDQLHVSYSNGALGSILGLTYQDAHHALSFKGDQLRRVSTDLGEEVTVTLKLTVDAGSTTFTLVVPRVAVSPNQHVGIKTLGITALHRTPLVPLKHAQLDSYAVTALRGSASSTPF